MELIIAWCSFIGAWLLFAGPIYQAALELRDQDMQVDRIREAGSKLTKPAKISAWWWLLPPVKLFLERNRNQRYGKAFMDALDTEDLEAFLAFMNKAVAWVFIALGALLIAIKETFELSEHYEVNTLVFVVIILGLFFLCVYNTVYRIKQSEKAISARKVE